jgi:hypothetical protein
MSLDTLSLHMAVFTADTSEPSSLAPADMPTFWYSSLTEWRDGSDVYRQWRSNEQAMFTQHEGRVRGLAPRTVLAVGALRVCGKLIT